MRCVGGDAVASLTMSGGDIAQEPSARDRILERAIAVIDEGGEAAVRTNTIAAECGTTPPVLYRAFGSREGLIVAAQAERYRRSTHAAVDFIGAAIRKSGSREELIANLRAAFATVMLPDLAPMRRLRVNVIGSAVSRPDLQAEIVKIDDDYAARFEDALRGAIANGWVSPGTDVRSALIWAKHLIGSRVVVEFGHAQDVLDAYSRMTVDSIIREVFPED